MKHLELQSYNQRLLDMWLEAVVETRIDAVSGFSELAGVIFDLCAPRPLGHNHDDVAKRMIGPMCEEDSILFDQAMEAMAVYEGGAYVMVEGLRGIAPTSPELLVDGDATTVISGHHHIMALQNTFYESWL
jgi:hypothetical protein